MERMIYKESIGGMVYVNKRVTFLWALRILLVRIVGSIRILLASDRNCSIFLCTKDSISDNDAEDQQEIHAEAEALSTPHGCAHA